MLAVGIIYQNIWAHKVNAAAHVQVSAHDYDTGPDGEVDYALDSSPNISRIFTLDSSTGVLQVRSPLNREDRAQYMFHVLAFDRGTPRKTSSATVIISVQDQNDEKPYFTRSGTHVCFLSFNVHCGRLFCLLSRGREDVLKAKSGRRFNRRQIEKGISNLIVKQSKTVYDHIMIFSWEEGGGGGGAVDMS